MWSSRAEPSRGTSKLSLELAIQIAELVSHAHQREVVLRDLKPSNLLLDRRDGRLHVTLVDLDLARIEGTDRRAASEATGTWGWSAPEQAALERAGSIAAPTSTRWARRWRSCCRGRRCSHAARARCASS